MSRASQPPFTSVLVANRGEIACRVIATLQRLGIRAIAVYSEPDRFAKHVLLADEALLIGGAAASESYLNVDAVMAAAVQSGAEALHPGYGFLSESTSLAAACEQAGVVFVGPSEHALSVMGDKIRSKQQVAQHGVPVTPGSDEAGQGDEQLARAAERIGYPLLVKPSAGGGGKGMQVVHSAAQLDSALLTARRVAAAAFADDTLFLERLIEKPRHIEVQLLADAHGNTLHLGERECSLQRRHQKVIEEAPSPLLTPETRARIGEAACAVARSVGYVGAGTVEFLVSDAAPTEFFFMEMNTRLQVEHPVTEMVTGIDIVEWQLRVAAGQSLPWVQADISLTGHSVEARVYSEDPQRGFLPTTGKVLLLREPGGDGIRVDSALMPGMEVGANYDPMLAKIIAWAPDRATALARLDAALAETVVLGLDTNIGFLRSLLNDRRVLDGHLDTGLIEEHLATARTDATNADAVPDAGALAVAAALLFEREAAARRAETQRSNSSGEGGNGASVAPLWRELSGWRLGGTGWARPVPFALWSQAEEVAQPEESGIGESNHSESKQSGDRVLHELTVHSDGHSLRVTRADATEREHQVRFGRASDAVLSSGNVSVELDGVTHLWSFAVDGADVWLAHGGITSCISVQSREEGSARAIAALRAKRERGAGGARVNPEVRTPMPGTIVALHVASGAHVERGDLVLTVEAMKMEHQLTAAASGVVSLAVAQGDTVRRDQVVATIESSIEPAVASEGEPE